jgi:integrase
MKVAAVTTIDVEGFMRAVADGKTAGRVRTGKKRGLSNVRGGIGTASRTVGLLGGIFTYAVRHHMRPDNPVQGVIRPADGRRERRLTDDEYAALGNALRAAYTQDVWPAAVAAARFLALTGWRSGEALALRWVEVDLARRTAILIDSKTGRFMRPLSHAACDVLRGLSRTEQFVFPPTRGDGRMTGFRKLWDRTAKLGNLPADVTPHVLRHSFASLAGDLGFSELTVAASLHGTAPHPHSTRRPSVRLCALPQHLLPRAAPHRRCAHQAKMAGSSPNMAAECCGLGSRATSSAASVLGAIRKRSN